MTDKELENRLLRIDGKSYPAYKDIKGIYRFDTFTLSIDRVQGDPFASPSRLSIEINHEQSRLPDDLLGSASRRVGAETFLAKAFSRACRHAQRDLGSGKSGLLAIDTPGQEVLARSCVQIGPKATAIRFSAGLPANGRRVLGRAASKLLVESIPEIVALSLVLDDTQLEKIHSYADTNEDANILRQQLSGRGLVAFVADGAILPRASGIDQRPLAEAIPFQSPDPLRTTITLPHAGSISGMGIPEGVTLIVGGGYHGKSTLLNALERGIYNHIPGDGRERVVARRDATKVRAEDGRSIARVDISPFINNLPGGKSTRAFSSENASGSTSQAASIIETLETGARLLLLDEDISATNFLIRDERMRLLVASDKEPITPLVQRVRELYEKQGVSTILALGGSGDYFEPAHLVIGMDNYIPVDLTAKAKQIVSERTIDSEPCPDAPFEPAPRFTVPSSISPYKQVAPYRGSRSYRSKNDRPPRRNIKVRGTSSLVIGNDEIDLSLLSQLIDPSQARTIGAALAYACEENLFEKHPMTEALELVLERVETEGLAVLGKDDLAETRLQELTAALNRMRSLKISAPSKPA